MHANVLRPQTLQLHVSVTKPSPHNTASGLHTKNMRSNIDFNFLAQPTAITASSISVASLDQLLGEADRTDHRPLQNRYADHPLVMFDNDRTADKNMVGAWAALLNLGRKGDAEKIRQLGITTFGEKDFDGAISAAIVYGTGEPPADEHIAVAGFVRIEVATDLQPPSGDDRDTAKKCLASAAQVFGDSRKQGVADKVEVVFQNAFGNSLGDYKEEQKTAAV
ncbi:hypothetical protein DOTSEDRAFT_39686 [Dothistroma septosporum NZE10]|uniref:Uncharacterized protein n=1 Tax=Dothistroma septosporum (strain NZE10 / CBS 128990) TaxID=675120 RepID=M2YI25_DOTSN|nr:hypothetical protein DOTSEDRAFT_39686 [Dothistroma septosporum NZE10]